MKEMELLGSQVDNKKIELFDSHAHYNDEQFKEDKNQVISSVKAEGITKLICVGYNVNSSKEAIEIAKNYDFIYSSCAISPNDIPQIEKELWKDIEQIKGMLQKKEENKIVAVGEIGLDYYWNKENSELQKKAFIEQIKIANEYDLPIVIHTREAVADTIDILKNKINIENKGIFHCCPLNRELVKEALKLDFYISLAGPITFKNSKNANEIIDMLPLDKILIETDSPYLSPEPLRGKRNDSRNVKYMAKKIAEVKNMDIEEIAKITYENAERVFKMNNKKE
ncbi:MAG: TatD family hydrolase [Clostridia bacterium]|nr:TatD family hydrolase [Clostridia bacterium]